MDTELLAIAAVLVIAAWVTLRVRESQTEPAIVPLTDTDDPNEG